MGKPNEPRDRSGARRQPANPDAARTLTRQSVRQDAERARWKCALPIINDSDPEISSIGLHDCAQIMNSSLTACGLDRTRRIYETNGERARIFSGVFEHKAPGKSVARTGRRIDINPAIYKAMIDPAGSEEFQQGRV